MKISDSPKAIQDDPKLPLVVRSDMLEEILGVSSGANPMNSESTMIHCSRLERFSKQKKMFLFPKLLSNQS
jgi:hypothetical protein